MKCIARIAIVVALFALLPAALLAQDDLTLESLADQIEAVRGDIKNQVSLLSIAGKERAEAVSILSGKVNSLVDRVVVLEELLSPRTFTADDGYCRIALSNRLHATTLSDYMNTYSGERLPDTIWVEAVWVSPRGDIAVVFEAYPPRRLVTEYWADCEFVGSSDWWAEEE